MGSEEEQQTGQRCRRHEEQKELNEEEQARHNARDKEKQQKDVRLGNPIQRERDTGVKRLPRMGAS